MTIRSAAKAVIVQDGAILMQLCRRENGTEYYDLPGGGQNLFETLEETVVRECLEETGFAVTVERFLALAEEISTDEDFRARYPGYAHRVLHIFLCRLSGAERVEPSEADFDQISIDWVPLAKLQGLEVKPAKLAEALPALLCEGRIGYLGAVRF